MNSRAALFRILPCQRLHHTANKVIWHRLIQGKLQIALLTAIRLQHFYEVIIAAHRRVDANMLLEGSEIEEDAFVLESRHLIADGFLGGGDETGTSSLISCMMGSASGETVAKYSSMVVNRGRSLMLFDFLGLF